MFNIYSQVRNELKDFFEKKIKIGSAIIDGREVGGYEYSQWDTIQNIEFVDGSKFLKGDRDSEGQQKFYVNIASFKKEVASKNIDIDLKNFLFVPEEDQSEYGTILLRKRFRKWAKDNKLSTLLNESVDRFPKYGTTVLKRVGKEVEIVPLLKLRNEQGAESLEKARFVIQEHTNMSYQDLVNMPDWDLSGLELEWKDSISVYERYGYVPLSFYKEKKGESYSKEDQKESVYCVVIVALDKAKHEKEGGSVLFIEETECPFVEAHYGRQDGRWLGIGEVEKQFENQAAKNMIFNMRKKSLAWSAKNIFQTQDDVQVNNLVQEIRDGDIIKINTPNGLVRVNTASQAQGDFTAFDNLVEQNSDQRSFTFEVSTGESLPSGTPFRLGAIVGQSANAYYNLKREKLGIFWKDVIYEFMLPTFLNSMGKECIEGIADTEEGFDVLREAKKASIKSDILVNAVINNVQVVPEAIDMLVELEMNKKNVDYYKMTREDVKALKYRFDIDITGESVDIPKKIETLTNLYQTLVQSGDMETAKDVLSKIMVLTGEKMPKSKPSLAQQQPQMSPQQQSPMQPMSQLETNQVGGEQ